MTDSRKLLLTLPPRERRKVLARQAKEMSEHYSATREDRTSWQGGRIYNYDSEETASSENSEEPMGKEGGQSDDLKGRD
jgi:hypothetical protein